MTPKIHKVKIDLKVAGFKEDALIKKPELGDMYVSSTDGRIKLWRHKEAGKALKIVLIPLVTVDMAKLPKGLLVHRKGFDQVFLSAEGNDLGDFRLSDTWQANTWRSCPFGRGTVSIEAKHFHADGVMRPPTVYGDARSVQWDSVAQFRVTGLCDGVEYKEEPTRVNY